MAELKRLFCAMCKKPVYRRLGRFHENVKLGWEIYCSRKCEYQYKRRRRKLTCENCGRAFERTPSSISPHNYCSQACAAIVNNKRYPKRHPEYELKVCLKCGKRLRKGTGNKKYCSIKCRREIERHTSKELLGIIKNTAYRIKRAPTKRELRKIDSACRKIFGSWNNAIAAAGLQPNRSHEHRMYKRTKGKAIDGHLCDSISELLIDNWLYENNIQHERNANYPGTHHRADWETTSKNQKIFIEYFGLANDSPRYDRTIKEKKELCRKHKIKLIEIYPQNLYPEIHLDRKLKSLN
jgi:hypothetical protein